MKEPHKALLELAQKATPGTWAVSLDPDGKPYEILGVFNGTLLDPVVKCQWGSGTKRGQNDYAYIAAAHPTAIIALISELEAANKRIAYLEERMSK